MSIPVQNVYYLLLYAWGHVQRKDKADLERIPFTKLHDLLGHVLAEEVGVLIARGLHRDYVSQSEVVGGVRGKLDLAVTLKRNLLADARTFCSFDELQYDVARNRIIKGTLRNLLRVATLDPSLRERIRRLHRKLDAVADVEVTRRDFRTVQGHRLAHAYDFILRLCLLIFDSVVLDARTGKTVFHDFREDEARMAGLFEDFVFNFFRLEQRRAKVAKPLIRWHDASGSEHDLLRLPVMRTDVVLEWDGRRLVLDAKYYREALKEHRGRERLRSAHLYQIFAYLENMAAPAPGLTCEGMLLYPVVEQPFAFTYRLKGYRIAIRSINLAQPWPGIHRDMLALLETFARVAA